MEMSISPSLMRKSSSSMNAIKDKLAMIWSIALKRRITVKLQFKLKLQL
jgi:hypothetical protein